uniref:Uncharacterized protein n=1 Tax=Arundo donax TaxID=35708 RepID=A0A0A9HKA7_ARUDO
MSLLHGLFTLKDVGCFNVYIFSRLDNSLSSFSDNCRFFCRCT